MYDLGEVEAFFDCPWCWQRVSVLIDLSAGGQAYVEDCEVCCRPIRLVYGLREGDEDARVELAWLEAERSG